MGLYCSYLRYLSQESRTAYASVAIRSYTSLYEGGMEQLLRDLSGQLPSKEVRI